MPQQMPISNSSTAALDLATDAIRSVGFKWPRINRAGPDHNWILIESDCKTRVIVLDIWKDGVVTIILRGPNGFENYVLPEKGYEPLMSRCKEFIEGTLQ